MSRIAVRLIIRGRVQGVGYRWWARSAARQLKLDGWIRNRADGAVELFAAGSTTAVEQLAGLCKRGPSSAVVTSVERFDAVDEDIVGFEVRPTI